MGGNEDGIYKHSAGENWANDISKLRTWDQKGPHRACTYSTTYPMSQVGHVTMLAMFKKE
jgi:hypothetical protein